MSVHLSVCMNVSPAATGLAGQLYYAQVLINSSISDCRFTTHVSFSMKHSESFMYACITIIKICGDYPASCLECSS